MKKIMELEIVCKPSSFKHGVSEVDINWAFTTARYDLPVEGDEDKRLLIGFDSTGNPLEIMYNELDDGRINVFHAMPCRSIYYHLLNDRRNQ